METKAHIKQGKIKFFIDIGKKSKDRNHLLATTKISQISLLGI